MRRGFNDFVCFKARPAKGYVDADIVDIAVVFWDSRFSPRAVSKSSACGQASCPTPGVSRLCPVTIGSVVSRVGF